MAKHVDFDIDGTVTERDLTDEEKNSIRSTSDEVKMRLQRNQLLIETDWMALNDVTMSDAWKTYRQALRDLPAQSGFPDVDFPTKPS